MPTYFVTIGQREYQVQIGDGIAHLDGEAVLCQLTSLNGNGMHQLSRGHQTLEIYLSPQPNGVIEAYVAGQRVVAQVGSMPRRAHRDSAAAKQGDLLAPMPGLIAEVLVEEGQAVESGQVLLIQESMKMQMQLRAPCAGQVARLAAQPGRQVEKGTLLVSIAAV